MNNGIRIKVLVLAFATLASSGCDSGDSNATNKINGSVHITAGRPAEALTTVNGSVRVDDNAAATSASTVNGNIHFGAHATAESANTVNGTIIAGPGSRIAASLSTVNGSITIKEDASVGGTVSNVNGDIELDSAHVGGGLKTVSGSIRVLGTSRVEAGIVVEKPSNELLRASENIPKIIIGPGAIVQGELRFERKVELHVSDKANVGVITGATPIPFTGDTLPE